MTERNSVQDWLAVPSQRWRERDGRWRALIDWHDLFERLKSAVAELSGRSDNERAQHAASWESSVLEWNNCHQSRLEGARTNDPVDYAGLLEKRPQRLEEWRKLTRLVGCAAQVVREPLRFSPGGSADRAVFPGSVAPSSETQIWRQLCGRLLIAEPGTVHSVGVVVLSKVSESIEGEAFGKPLLLELTVIGDGTNTVMQHPVDLLAVLPPPAASTSDEHGEEFQEEKEQRDKFTKSMRVAWDAARSLLPDLGSSADGVWRVRWLAEHNKADHIGSDSRRWAGEVVLEPQGPSAGGAALRGWWHALQKLIPDDEVVVVAEVNQINNGFKLTGVYMGPGNTWLIAKLNALAQDARFDTVVVVDDDKGNRAVADTILPHGMLKVLIPDA